LVFLVTGLGKDVSAEDVQNLALGIEFLHTATLIHDDIIDHAKTRRGVPTIHTEYGEAAAIVVGDQYIAKSFELLARGGRAELVEIFAGAVQSLCLGEFEQSDRELMGKLTVDEYMLIIERKTAALVSVACRLAAMVAKLEEITVAALSEYGRLLGLAFQIADDCLDYDGDPAVTGKPSGGDIHEGTKTLPYLLVSDEVRFEGDGEMLRKRVIDLGGVVKAREQASRLAARAVEQLAALPDCPERTILKGLAEWSVSRSA
jgi:geranylgeranyl pyrophosphate synthase